MPIDRRTLLLAGTAGFLLPAPRAQAAPRNPSKRIPLAIPATDLGITPDTASDQTVRLQRAIDHAATRRLPLQLPPGRIVAGRLTLRDNSTIQGTAHASHLGLIGEDAGLYARSAHNVSLKDLHIDGRNVRATNARSGLLAMHGARHVSISGLSIDGAPAAAILLQACNGTVENCRITRPTDAAIFSIDAQGLRIADNTILQCANNAILVWRNRIGEDGTLVTNNRIAHVRADAGGSGQNGNGINVYRAGNVIVAGNHVADCAYSAIRANSASNIQMMGNNCTRIGEVALYAEFAFQGAVIANNVVDHAATGVSVTNFNDGGRLAVVQANVIRNLYRREHEPVDKRGVGIAVEADTTVTGNVVEGAPTAGIAIGWHAWMRNVNATGNIIRNAGIGIAVSGDRAAGSALIAHNTIAGAANGAIRTMRGDVPFGPDLLIQPPPADGNLRISGNIGA